MDKGLSSLAKFENLMAKGGMFGADGKPLMDFSKLSSEQKGIIGELIGPEKVKAIIPDAERIGRLPEIGGKGIDDLYKVNKPGVDYVVVEYKFGSSKLKLTDDGLQMSDSWLTGAETGTDRILKSVGNPAEALNIEAALKAGRIEKWLVHTDPFGNVTVGILDKNGKFFPKPLEASKILGSI